MSANLRLSGLCKQGSCYFLQHSSPTNENSPTGWTSCDLRLVKTVATNGMALLALENPEICPNLSQCLVTNIYCLDQYLLLRRIHALQAHRTLQVNPSNKIILQSRKDTRIFIIHCHGVWSCLLSLVFREQV